MKRITFILFGTTLVLFLSLLLLASQHEIHAKYSSKIKFKHQRNTIVGTLHLPDTSKPYPVIIFVHGDGAQDRFSGGAYVIMMNHFLNNGIGVFSYDKAGVGDSTGNWLHQSMSDRAKQIIEAVKTLSIREDVISNKIGLLGFSQAGWVLPKIAKKGYGISYAIIVGGAINWMEQIDFYEPNQLKYLGYIPKDDPSEAMQTFIKLNKNSDATEDLKKVDIPLLGVFGEDDLRVDAKKSYEVYSEIFRNKKESKMLLIPNATHEILNSKYYNFLSPWTTLAKIQYFIEGENAYNHDYMKTLIEWVKSQ
jgi:dipeptidyl aminopeptidase/acylaminoacyl peptidase